MEGLEEVFTDIVNKVAQKLTYADKMTWEKVFSTEDAWDSFLSGLLLSRGMSGADAIAVNSNVFQNAGLEDIAGKLSRGEVLTAAERQQLLDAVLQNTAPETAADSNKSSRVTEPGRYGVGWDGRVAVAQAKGKNITIDGKTYKLLGKDANGSPVYQDVEVLKAQQGNKENADTAKELDVSTMTTANNTDFSQVEINSIKDDSWRVDDGTSAWLEESLQSLFKTEESIVKSENEKAVLYGTDGEVIFEKTGDREYVQFTGSETQKMLNGILTHNHPNNSCFSPEDIHTLFNAKLSEIRLVTQDGIYRLQKPLEWPKQKYSLEKIEEIYYAIDKEICTPLFSKAYAGEISFAEAERIGQIEVIREFSKRYGLAFEFEAWEDKGR